MTNDDKDLRFVNLVAGNYCGPPNCLLPGFG